mgnify:CR=1 FL=1
MILTEFSKFLQQHNEELITHNTTPLELLHQWLYEIINKNPKSNVEKIIHKEILYAQNDNGEYVIIGKSSSGRKLVTALINFSKSYDNYNQAKWLEMTEKNFHKKN